MNADADATADDVIRATRAVTEASMRATSAARSADEHESVVAAANFARQAIGELLATTIAAATSGADSAELRARTLHAGRDVAVQTRELLARLVFLLGRPGNADAERSILIASQAVSEVSQQFLLSSSVETLRLSLSSNVDRLVSTKVLLVDHSSVKIDLSSLVVNRRQSSMLVDTRRCSSASVGHSPFRRLLLGNDARIMQPNDDRSARTRRATRRLAVGDSRA